MNPFGDRSNNEGERRRRSPISLFHAVLFIMGGGLWLLWSPWGAALVVLVVASAFAVARAFTAPANQATTRAALGAMVDDLTELRSVVDKPGADPEAELHALQNLHDRGLISPEQYEQRRAELTSRDHRHDDLE